MYHVACGGDTAQLRTFLLFAFVCTYVLVSCMCMCVCTYICKQNETKTKGFHVINLQKTWNKLILAARIIVTVKNPGDVAVMSTRLFGQRGAIKYAHYTGATSMVGKWVPGTFCNPQNRAFAEPRLLIVDDPSTCFAVCILYLHFIYIYTCNAHIRARERELRRKKW